MQFIWEKMFFKDVSYAHQGCIYLIKNTVKQLHCEILLQFKNNWFLFHYILKCNLCLWWQSCIFSVTGSFRNGPNMLIWCSIYISYIVINVEKHNTFISGFFDEWKIQKNRLKYLLEIYLMQQCTKTLFMQNIYFLNWAKRSLLNLQL